MAADWADRRTLIGVLLRGFFQELTLQSLGLLEDLSLQITHRLILVGNAPVQTGRQTRHPVQHWLVQRFVTAAGRNRWHAAVAHALGSTPALSIQHPTNEMRPLTLRSWVAS